jgi:hypothetical protein
MFGIPITTLISLAVTYGPDVIKFVQAADPLLHQLVVAATPLAKKVVQQFGVTVEVAAAQGVSLLAIGAHGWSDDELKNWWDKQSVMSN